MVDDEARNDEEVEAYKDDVVDEASYLEDGVGQNEEEVEVAYEDGEAQKVDQKNVSQMEAQAHHVGKVVQVQKEKNVLGNLQGKGETQSQNGEAFFFCAFFFYRVSQILVP